MMKSDKKCQHGSAALETALAATVFFAMVIGIIDFGRVQYYRSNLQHAVSQSTRFAVIGTSLKDPDAPGSAMSREASIAYLVRKISGLDDIDASDITIGAVRTDGTEVVGAGAGGDVITVTATYRVPLIAPLINLAFPGGLYEFTVRTSFRNEEFS
ncbi:MAG: pilus assembly protein [Myxococcales bacterium]|jgi:Flp pilus assembly protein TadG|nr:MAG: pilus assembly protein [Myxococcales bacterium]